MASMKDAWDECITGHNAIVKYIIAAIPVFCGIYFFKAEPQNLSIVYTCAVVTAIIALGAMSRICNNVMNFRETILPTANIFVLLFDAIRAIIAIGPALAINGGIAWYLVTNFYPMIAVDWIRIAATYITYAVCGSIVLTVFMLYSKKFNPLDAFDVKAISDSCIDVLIQTIWLAIQIAVIDAVLAGIVTYLCWLFIGLDNFITYIAWSITAVINIALIGNYLGQLNYEALHQAEAKAQKKKEKEELKELQKSSGPTTPASF